MKALHILMMANKTTQPVNQIYYGYLYNGWVENHMSGANAITATDQWSIPSDVHLQTLLGYVWDTYGESGIQNQASMMSINRKGDDYEMPFWPSNAPHVTPSSNSLNTSLVVYYMRLNTGVFAIDYRWPFRIIYIGRQYDGLAQIIESEYVYIGEYYALNTTRYYGIPVRLVRAANASELLLADGALCDNYIGNDGKSYTTVKLGDLVWMAQNLAETKFRNGNLIPILTSNQSWSSANSIAMCAPNNDDSWV